MIKILFFTIVEKHMENVGGLGNTCVWEVNVWVSFDCLGALLVTLPGFSPQ